MFEDLIDVMRSRAEQDFYRIGLISEKTNFLFDPDSMIGTDEAYLDGSVSITTVPQTMPTPSQPALTSGQLAWGGHANGRIPISSLKPIGGGNGKRYGYQNQSWMMPAAADAWLAMVAKAKTEGINLRISSAYRTYEHQADLHRARGGKGVARPGTSVHGWARAIDIGGLWPRKDPFGVASNARMRGSKLYLWLAANAPSFGFIHPAWARDGRKIEEAWHWEYHGK